MNIPAQHAVAEAMPEVQADTPTRSGLLAVGGILGALASASCCIVPLVLFSLGASGAWIGNLSALSAYQPIFVVVTLGFLGAGFYIYYRKPKAACAEGSYCAKPISNRIAKIGLWSATVLATAALVFPYVAPWLLDV